MEIFEYVVGIMACLIIPTIIELIKQIGKKNNSGILVISLFILVEVSIGIWGLFKLNNN